jgi:hypothetical protein
MILARAKHESVQLQELMRPTTISGGAARAAAVLLAHDPERWVPFSDEIMRK